MAFLKVTLGNSDSLQEIKNFFKVDLKATVVNTESWQKIKHFFKDGFENYDFQHLDLKGNKTSF